MRCEMAQHPGDVIKIAGVARFLLLTSLAATGIGLLSCGQSRPARFTFTGEALGSFYTITIVAPPPGVDAEQARRIVDETLDEINRLMSTYQADSELSRFNRHADATPFSLSPSTYKVFQMALRIAEESGGAFDITVGPLVNAWGFGPEAFLQPPEEAVIEALRARVGYQKLTLHPDGAVSKSHPEVYCDLSGIAKGYATDAVAAALESIGVSSYMVEVGGEIRVAGANPDGAPWRLGIERPLPDTRQLHTVALLESGALATSGDYRNMYEVDGRRFSHTIDPQTGYPVQHTLASVSVIHESCAMADGYATALMAMGPEKAHAFADEHGLAVMLIIAGEDDTYETVTTDAFAAYKRQP